MTWWMLVIYLGSTCHCPQIVTPFESERLCEVAAVELSKTEGRTAPYIAEHRCVKVAE